MNNIEGKIKFSLLHYIVISRLIKYNKSCIKDQEISHLKQPTTTISFHIKQQYFWSTD